MCEFRCHAMPELAVAASPLPGNSLAPVRDFVDGNSPVLAQASSSHQTVEAKERKFKPGSLSHRITLGTKEISNGPKWDTRVHYVGPGNGDPRLGLLSNSTGKGVQVIRGEQNRALSKRITVSM